MRFFSIIGAFLLSVAFQCHNSYLPAQAAAQTLSEKTDVPHALETDKRQEDGNTISGTGQARFQAGEAAVNAGGVTSSPVNVEAYVLPEHGKHADSAAGAPASRPVTVMVRWRLDPGWYVYAPVRGQDKPVPAFTLISPGKGGQAVKEDHVLWPAYHKKQTAEGEAAVYEGEIWTALKSDRKPETIKVTWLACSNVCSPGSADAAVGVLPDELKDAAMQALSQLVPDPAPVPEKRLPVLMILAMAFLAGVILNVMPCVMPVLALKLFKLGTGTHYKEGLAFMGGTTFTFVSLAMILVSLKLAGHAVGWGFQMQSPLVVSILTGIFTILGLSMLGVLEIGTSLTRVGDYHKPSKRPLVEAFWQGMLGVVVATPCSAPFMGSALAIALTESLPVTIAVFICLGVGLAFPFTVLACVPRLKRFFPKPGMWMVRIKQLLGFTLLATVIWLLSVLHEQVDGGVFFHQLWAILIISVGAWLWGSHLGKMKRILAGAVISIGLAWFPYHQYASCKAGDKCERVLPWEPYQPQSHIGPFARPTLIYFTAQWCLTCKVQERLVLNDAALSAFFKKNRVALIKADWTDHNPEITGILNRYGRHSVPFIILFKPGEAKPALTGEFTTASKIMEVLGKDS